MDIEKALELAGLSRIEIKIFLTLFKHKQLTGGEIIKITGLQRSTVYFCLDSLIRKGLISFFFRNNRRIFYSATVHEIMYYIKKKKNELIDAEKTMKEKLKEESKIEKEEIDAKIYEGWPGLRSAFEEATSTMKKGNTAYVFIVGKYHIVNIEKTLQIIKKIEVMKYKRHFKTKVIVDVKEKNSVIGKSNRPSKNREVRYISIKEKEITAVTHVYDGAVLIVEATEKPKALLIKSKPIIKAFKSYFELLWKIAK